MQGHLNDMCKRYLNVPPRNPSIRDFHRSFPDYFITPLLELKELAQALGLGMLYAKIESTRLGMSSFKILGASWGVSSALQLWLSGEITSTASVDECRRQLKSVEVPPVLIAATEGNYGCAVARVARLIGAKSRIYSPRWTAANKIDQMLQEGADLINQYENYDDAVDAAIGSAKTSADLLVLDTARNSHELIPALVSDGYSTLFAEIAEMLPLTHIDAVAVQVGVGGLAGKRLV